MPSDCIGKEKRRLLADVLRQIGIGTVHETDTVDYASLQLRYTTIGIVIWAEDGLGYLELLKYIRHELPGRAREVPFLCITEGWNNEQLTQARNAGASGFATFPLTLRGMLKAVSGLLGDTREFIKSEAYIGPDRRRHDLPNYCGPHRRSTDVAGVRAATQADTALSQPPPRARPEPPPPGGMTGEAPSRANGTPAPPKKAVPTRACRHPAAAFRWFRKLCASPRSFRLFSALRRQETPRQR